MKILYVSPWAHRPIHYAPAAVHETKKLKEAGLDVTLLTYCGLRDPTLSPSVPQRTVIEEDGFFSRRLPFFYRWKPLKWLTGCWELVSTLRHALALYRREGFDVLHLRDGEPLVFLPYLLTAFAGSKVRGVVVLVSSALHISGELRTARGALSYHTLVPMLNNLKLWGPVLRRSLSRNNFTVVCPEKFSAESYGKYLDCSLAKKIRVVPFGIDRPKRLASLDEARKKLGLPLGKNIFLLFGGLHPGKDPQSVVLALKENLEGVQVIIAGVSVLSEGFSSIRALVRAHHLEDRILIIDRYVPEADKEWYFRASDAVLLSYKAQFNQSASTLWDTCRFQKPVIASRIEPLAAVARYGLGLSFEPQNAQSLRGKMLEFIALTPHAKALLAKNCDRYCDDFSSDKWAEEYATIYRNLLS